MGYGRIEAQGMRCRSLEPVIRLCAMQGASDEGHPLELSKKGDGEHKRAMEVTMDESRRDVLDRYQPTIPEDIDDEEEEMYRDEKTTSVATRRGRLSRS
ncbi:hypothetical protein AMATHDRAFT_10839 [Amanita thiersii Skay4041]|uniref:Uncharacterized protein n=1 Tax=Amanita thiersii Skay4041 TaxID=703135 RepID=A0A2A9NAN6_9AGAR|nr:hypothetical protein AMATHDRAFT_10839 [Amanita thiersii Skay4041]